MNRLLAGICSLTFRRKQLQSSPKNILILRSGAIGDVLMSTPLIHNIREYYLDAKLSYLVGKWSAPAVTANPHLDEVVSFEDSIIYQKSLLGVLHLVFFLKRRHFDLCFVLDKSWHWGILTWLAGIPQRIGFDRCGEGFALSKAVSFDGSKYELEYYLDLARMLNIPVKHNSIEFYPSKQDRSFAAKLFQKYNLQNKRVVILIPGGANNPSHQMHVKRWPLTNFNKLAGKLIKSGVKIICLGGKEDLPLISTLYIENLSIVNLAGQLSIAQSIAIMSRADCVVTPDSGPLHMASAAKTRIIALFGPTPPHRFAPENADVLYKTNGCHGCYSIFAYNAPKLCKTHECMKNITVDEVFEAVKRCLKGR